MSNRCDVLDKKPGTGNAISHSHRRTKRTWRVNAHKRRFWLASERRWITLTVSSKGLRTIDKRGIEAIVIELRAKGMKL
jgi:large subunit ribosomal protein L28